MSEHETHVIQTEPTPRQAKALKILQKAASRKNPKMPTLAELGEALGGISAVSARQLLAGLEKRGHILRRRSEGGRCLAGQIDLIGS